MLVVGGARMWTFIIIISVVWIGFLIWARADYKRRNRDRNKKKQKPPFRTEEDLDKYAKPMEDEHRSRVDFDDAD